MDILNALVKHYDAMAAAGNATSFGWTHKFAQYAVELNDDGEIDRIFALGDLSDKKNKGEEFKMPTRRPRSGKLPIPYVFCDDAEHLLGKVGEASNLVRYTMMRDAVFMLRDLLGHSKALDVVYKFYETWDPEKALDNKCVSDVMEAKGQEKKTFILFYNGVPVFDDETFRKSYAAIVNKYGEMPIDTLKGGEIALLPEPIKIRSMISGNIGFKARLFRAITAWGNKKNGPVTNTLLSNNKANTEYFGRQQGNAIPITMQDEHKIYEAATDLLGSKHRFPVPATSQSLYVDACYKLLEVTPIEHNDNTTIDVQAADAMIDLSPCISIYMQAGFFNSYDIDDALAYYMDLHKDMQYLKIKKGATVEDKVLLLTALETNQCRYVKQVKPPFVNAKAKMSLSMRLGTVFTPDEYVQARGDIDIHTNDHKVIYASGLADVVKNSTVYCIKFISSLAHKHFLQCACSMIALGLPYGVVWNVKSNLMYGVKIKDKDALIDAILKCITKRAYNGADYYTCRKGFVQDTASIIDRWTDDGYAEEPTAITSGDGIAIIKQGTRYFVMDGARRNTLNDNFGFGFADVKDACLAYAKSCELQKTVDHDSPYSEVEFWLDQNKAFEEYMTQVSHEIEQHEEGPYAKYKSFATPAVRKMLAEKGLTITFPEKVLIKVWKMRRAEDAMYQKIEEAKKQNSPNVPLDEAFFDSELVDSVEGSIESAKAKSKPKKESALPFSKYGADEKKSYRVVKSDELSKPNQPRYVVVEAATDKVLDNANGYGYLSYQAAWKGYSYKSKHHLDGTKKPISKSAKEQAKKKAAFFSTDSEQLSFG